MQYFNIQVASQLSGVASATIRAWEKRYNAVIPDRAENKHRLYSELDIEKLTLLYQLTDVGQGIGKIAHLELADLKDLYAKLLHKPYQERYGASKSFNKTDLEKMLANFLFALDAYKLDIISHELDKAKSLLNPRDLCLNVLIPLFREVGRKVEANELSIAQEHTFSAIVKFYMGQMIGQHYQKSITREDLIIITTPEGELHEIGILASALLCVHYGLKFIYLSSNLPSLSLAEAINALNPKVVLLGATRFELREKENLDDYLEKVKSNLKVETRFWVGGNLKPYIRTELEKKKIKFFPSLESLDESLKDF